MFYQTPFTAQGRRNVTKIGDNKPTTVWQNLPPNGALFLQGFLITEVYEYKYCMKLKPVQVLQVSTFHFSMSQNRIQIESVKKNRVPELSK